MVKQTTLKATEAEIQKAIIEFLEIVGCEVLVNTVKLRGRAAGKHNTGQSKGIPDLSFWHPKWKAPIWIGLEIKREGLEGKADGWHFSPEQKRLFDLGATEKAHSIDDARAIFYKWHPLLIKLATI